jgi:two-component system response regulator DesR
MKRLRVLVVDDHDVVHWGFRLMLGQMPWVERCLSARTGAEAVAVCRRYEPHVAVNRALRSASAFVRRHPHLAFC